MSHQSTIFIVDDDWAVRDSLRALLESYGLRVEDFDTTRTFLDAFDPKRRGCLVLDLHLPRSGGLELLRETGIRGIRLPVIVVTGSLDAQTEAQIMEAGAVAVLEKPFDDSALLNAIRRAMNGDATAATTGAD